VAAEFEESVEQLAGRVLQIVELVLMEGLVGEVAHSLASFLRFSLQPLQVGHLES
jgi:hypothetical protein